MFSHYFKTAVRNLLRNKLISAINILGLSTGLAVCLIIYLFVSYQKSYDTHHTKADQIYRVVQDQLQSGEWYAVARTPAPMAPYILENYPDAENASRTAFRSNMLLSAGETHRDGFQGVFADPAFMEIFDHQILQGDPQQALSDPYSIILTESLRKNMFQETEEVLGKTILFNQETPLIVKAVIADIPRESHIPYDYIIPFSLFETYGMNLANWNANAYYTYVQLREGTDISAIDRELTRYIQEDRGQDDQRFYLQPLTDIFLKSDFAFNTDFGPRGKEQTIYFFSLIAFIILLIACINFTNLSTAKALKRTREIGLRKVVGAGRNQLIRQFMGESLLTVSISFILAIFISQQALPFFHALTGLEIYTDWSNPSLYLGMGGIFLLTMLLAGSYPAFILSSYKPVEALSQKIFGKDKGSGVRKVLVSGQFIAAVALTGITIIIQQQLNFIENRDLGIDKEQLVYVELKGTLLENYSLVREKLTSHPEIASVSGTNYYSMPFNWVGSSTLRKWEGQQGDDKFNISQFAVDYDFLQTFQIPLLEGRDFSPSYATDTANYVLNKAAVARMGLSNPVGSTYYAPSGNSGTIIGIIDDFHFNSLYEEIQPVAIELAPERVSYLLLRIPRTSLEAGLAQLTSTLDSFEPKYSWSYEFLKDDFQTVHQEENLAGSMYSTFTFIAIILSCLGLLGLAIFSTEHRSKEISIRKVLGASVRQITQLFLSHYLKLIGIASLIAIPLFWWLMDNWLSKFAYRIDLELWHGLTPGFLILLIAVGTIGIHTYRKAMENPASALRGD